MAPNVHLATVLPPHAPRRQDQRVQSGHRPSPAGYFLTPTAGLTKTERSPISTIGLSIFSMSPNRAIRSDRSSFLGRSPVGAPGRVGGGHFRRAQPSQFAHGCAPTDKRHQGDFLVERNSFRFSRVLAGLHPDSLYPMMGKDAWVAGADRREAPGPKRVRSKASPPAPPPATRILAALESVEFSEKSPFFRSVGSV